MRKRNKVRAMLIATKLLRHLSFPSLAAVGLAVALSAGLSACAEAENTPPPPPEDPNRLVPTAAERMTAQKLVEARPYEMKVPSAAPAPLDPTMATGPIAATEAEKKLWPLLVILHGYGATGVVQDLLFGMSAERDRLGYIIATPDGLHDKTGKQFWNATDVCCDFDGQKVDDVAYIDSVILDIASKYRIDKRRVFLMGHSNGGFMSYRMACDRSSRIAAFVSLAGANYADMSKCRPTEAVAALQVHGDKDEAVPIEGGTDPRGSLPSAKGSVEFWARQGGCEAMPTTVGTLDLENNLPGAETTISRWAGCKKGGAELWVMKDAFHVPSFKRPAWAEATWAFLSSHAKP